MAQTPCVYRTYGDTVPYVPGSLVLAGTVHLIGTTIVTIVPKDITADEDGATAMRGVFNVPKDNSDVAAGDALYWNATGDPVGGTAGSGAFTKTVSTNVFGGIALEAAGTTVGDVDMFLRSIDGTVPGAFGPISAGTAAAANSAIGNATVLTNPGFYAITASDNTKAVKLPEAATGKIVILKNTVTTAILKVFPSVNDSINAAAANAVYNQANGSLRVYVAENAVAWWTDPETPT